jgi:hypothetical protein
MTGATRSYPVGGRRPTAAAPSATPLWELRSTALGRPTHVAVVGGDPGVLEDAGSRLAELDALWSADSRHGDLARLRRWPGVVQDVAPETVLLVALAVRAADGAGHPNARCGELPEEVVVDVRHCRVGLPGAVGPALPDLARALAADLVAADLVDAEVAGALVTVGDASRAEGAAPDREGWLVPVAGRAFRLRRGGLVPAAPASGAGTTGTVLVADEAWRALAAAWAAAPAPDLPSRPARPTLRPGALR